MKIHHLAPLVLVCSIATLAVELPNIVSPFTFKSANSYAAKIAATIQNRPECQTFKDQIMAHANGNLYDGKTVTPIITTKQKAIAGGCAK